MGWGRQGHEPPMLRVGARLPDLESDLNRLLEALCVEWGFCNRLTGADLIAMHAPLTADAFARAVLTAEGMSPDQERRWMERMSKAFTVRYGESVDNVRAGDF